MSELSNNNVLSYPTMTRQRADKIQAKEIAYAEDVNAEFDHIIDVYNRLVALLTGEWGDGTGRIYDLVDNAVSLANEALAKANDCVQKSGDTMTGHLSISLVPSSDYHVVNKKYVDDTIQAELADPVNRIGELEKFRDNLNASQVKLENANFSSTNVNDGMTELFISVSNGKKTVADAITGKGVATSGDASFKQMADNINAILTFNEGTAGGTATAQDIMYGKTAYARNTLIVGTYVPIDLSDATATSDKILEGYTAYVYGGKIIGTYIPPREYPVYGTDTSNATATADDIKYGKTAYARGQLLIGTAMPEIEEIYGTVDNEPYKATITNLAIGEPPDGQEKIKYGNRDYLTFTRDGNYCVSSVIGESTGKKYIESFMVTSDGLTYQASTNQSGNTTYKKYRYSYEELGLVDDDGNIGEVTSIAFSNQGLSGKSEKCLLAIAFYTTVPETTNRRYYIKILTYHAEENGVIGKAYDTERDIIDIKYKIEEGAATNARNNILTFANNDIYKFYMLTHYPTTGSKATCRCSIGKIRVNASGGINSYYIYLSKGTTFTRGNDEPLSNIRCSINDEVLYADVVYTNRPDINHTEAFSIKDDILPTAQLYIDTVKGEILNGGVLNVITVSDDVPAKLKIYNLSIESGKVSSTLIKTINLSTPTVASRVYLYVLSWGIVSRDSSKLAIIVGAIPHTSNFIDNASILFYDISDIMALEEGATLDYIQIEYLYDFIYNSKNLVNFQDTNGTRIYMGCSYNMGVSSEKGFFETLETTLDLENIIGVKYKNQFFMKVAPNLLTAGGGDVKEGKTFIGWMGYPETGTGKVEE